MARRLSFVGEVIEDRGALALPSNGAYPIRAHRSRATTALATDDDPVRERSIKDGHVLRIVG